MATQATSSSPSSTSSSSSSSSSCPQWNYDVFLSFCGVDTRKNFTDHLYTALKQKELLKAIEESKYAIIVLSTNYAFSKWCLKELAKIVECKKKTGLTILPVFYHVDPSDVRNQRGIFAEAFAKHEEDKVNTRDVQAWKAALKDVGLIAGSHVHDRHESRVIQEILERISSELNLVFQSTISNELVGIESRVKDMLDLYLDEGRLWHCEDVLHTLKNNTGTAAVKGIKLNTPNQKEESLSAEAFTNMTKLRFLKMYYSDILLSMLRRHIQFKEDDFIIIPGREIPKWFRHQSVGTLVNLQVPSDKLKGVAVCAVFVLRQHHPLPQLISGYITTHSFQWYLNANGDESESFLGSFMFSEQFGNGGTHRLEVGDSERGEVAIEGKNEVAEEEGFGVERSGGVRGESWVGVREESGGAEAKVHEDMKVVLFVMKRNPSEPGSFDEVTGLCWGGKIVKLLADKKSATNCVLIIFVQLCC
ncbi:hypothetical protein CMV_019221 [Castanea mollissima]|uniref:TIR domain-containing protein n=1 Tax=Castanea mollissima TaxID=60419 RepID=A0A8J4QQK0_9ROSI|nr:hypothetical protein CMV_019221 [Castanea mollissima]